MIPLRRRLLAAAALVQTACGGGEGASVPTPVPASLSIVAGDAQSARYGTGVAVAPSVSVRDAQGVAVSGAAVVFSVTGGDGTVTGASVKSNAQGTATVGSWTLGPSPGVNTLKATAGDASASFTATGVNGPPATLAIHAGDGQSAAGGASVAVPPAVLVTDGTFPAVNQIVVFSVAQGGGTVTPATAFTDASGVATAASWQLGASGAQRLTATVPGLSPVTFSATAIASIATSIVKISGDMAAGFAGNFTPVLPVVEVRNQDGGGMPDQVVTFAVTGGGGTASVSTVTTGGDGRASPGAWRFGPAGPQALTATVAGLPAVTINATAAAPPVSAFNVQVVFLDPQPTDQQKAAFLAARDRWQQVIVGDIPDYTGGIPIGACGPDAPPATMPGPIDDVVIFASVRSIDGGGLILAQAGPCLVRANGSLTIAGIVIFDSADLAFLATLGGGLSDVAFHEFGHILGFGTLWPDFGLLQFPGTSSVAYSGAAGRQAYAALLDAAGRTSGTFDVPVENTGGPGTQGGHWRESVFDREIMTGFYDSGGPNPFSALSAASMRDLTYVVNDAAADAYALPPTLGALRSGVARGAALREDLAPWPIRVVDDRGRLVRLARR